MDVIVYFYLLFVRKVLDAYFNNNVNKNISKLRNTAYNQNVTAAYTIEYYFSVGYM